MSENAPANVPGRGVAPGAVRIFDTTLRDGEQAPGAGLTVAEKIEVARQLVRLSVDVIEAGFPASSPGEFEAVQAIARETRDVAVAALARCKDGDPQRAVEAIRSAERPHLHVFIASSDIHLKHKLRISRDEALLAAAKWVALRAAGPRAGRRDRVQRRGCHPDGPRLPDEALRSRRRRGCEHAQHPRHRRLRHPGGVRRAGRPRRRPVRPAATVSVHCHNDLGLATSNTLAALQNGARQLEVCVNGLGERAGNASLEEVVMGIKTRPTQFPNLGTRVVTEQITPASRLVSYLTGFAVQPNKAVVGANAFAHESGIHQDGVIKNPLTYEIMTPQSVGLSGSQLTIGKLSGRRGLKEKLHTLGHDVDGEALDAVYAQVIALADAKKEVTDADLLAVIEQRATAAPSTISLEGWSVTSSHGGRAMGMVTLGIGDQSRSVEANGNGPVDALYGAIDQALESVLGWKPILDEYEIKAVSAGEDAQGQVIVRVRRSADEGPDAFVATGHGLSTNIIEASVAAYLAGAEKLQQDAVARAALLEAARASGHTPEKVEKLP